MQSPPSQIADALRRLSESDALRELENRLAAHNAFNLFDAIGVSSQELRHSDFLAFLLRPNEAHGLGDTFLKWFLGHALAHSPAPPISQDVLNKWDLSDAHIGREPDNIDLFITSAKNRLAVIIENKIRTGEHSDQLTRYMETAKAQGYGGSGSILLGVYLTRHGGKSSHADYLPIGYEAVCTELECLCKTNAFTNAASPDVETTVHHYTRMLRSKKIVSDPEIAKLCRELYAQHQIAFDRVFAEQENKIEQKIVTSRIDEVIGNAPGIVPFHKGKSRGVNYSQFIPASWANEKGLLTTNPKVRNPRCFYIQVETRPSGYVEVSGIVGPCKPQIRQRLEVLIRNSGWLRFVHHPGADGEYRCFYRFPLRDDGNSEEITNNNLADAWQKWAETEGPKFADLIQPGDFPAV